MPKNENQNRNKNNNCQNSKNTEFAQDICPNQDVKKANKNCK